jgi:hypothetical protein
MTGSGCCALTFFNVFTLLSLGMEPGWIHPPQKGRGKSWKQSAKPPWLITIFQYVSIKASYNILSWNWYFVALPTKHPYQYWLAKAPAVWKALVSHAGPIFCSNSSANSSHP